LVISQNPAAGGQVPFGSAVALVVSTGPCSVTVPNVAGQTQTAAGTALTGAGLVTGAVTQQCSSTVAAGLVISQIPAAGAQAPFGSAVALVVSTGLCNVTVPNVVGQTQAAAGSALAGANLSTGTVTQQCSNTVAAGLVISQNPAAGQQATVGSAVALVVSTGLCNVAVPNVVGQTQTAAGTALIGANLTTGAVTQQCSNTLAAGLVISQSPAAGEQTPFGSSVALVVSTGVCNLTVPNVVGLTQTAAGTVLTVANLTTGTVTEECSNTVAAGLVIRQTPAAGGPAPFGSAVALVVSAGSCSVTVPNVVGQTQAAALAALSGADLTPGTATPQCSNTVAAGLVISQTPAAGGQALFGSSVALVVSTGPCSVTVPNVLGLTQSEASGAITGTGLVVGAVTEDFSDTVPLGSVMGQTPEGGANRPWGSMVDIVVSKGVGTTMPNVLGMTQAGAESAIQGADLVVGLVVNDYSDTVPAGQVLSQSPAGGTRIAIGVAVSFVISLGPKTTVPDLTGMSLEDAQAALAAAGLVAEVTEEASETVPAGQIISQLPGAGQNLPEGSTVNLVVSSGPEAGGCACAGCNTGKSAFSLDSLGRMLGDLFLLGLSVMALTAMSRFKK
jgi:beta-lactam-binding protein with PASTA domain